MYPKTSVSIWIPALHAGMTQSEGLCLMIEVPPALFSQEPDSRQGGTMSNEIDVIAGVGLDQRARKSHWPDWVGWAEGASGLFLGLFLWGDMAFASPILLSDVAISWVASVC